MVDFRQMVEMVHENRDRLIRGSMEKVRALMDTSKQDAARLRSQLADLERTTVGLNKLLIDPEIDDAGKYAIKRQLSSTGAKMMETQANLERLLDSAHDNTEQMAREIEAVIEDATGRLESVSSPAALNQLVGELLGPSLVLPDGGTVALLDAGPETETATTGEVVAVPGYVAGACADPVCVLVGALFRRQIVEWR